MSESSPSPPTGERLPFSVAYLVTVTGMAVLNAVLFYLFALSLQGPSSGSAILVMLCALFGILFASACNLSALSLARWAGRQGLADRIILFVVINLAGLTLFILVAPRLI